MVAGHALIAFPAAYGDTGVMSFLVGERGVVYEADLGEDTLEAARRSRASIPATAGRRWWRRTSSRWCGRSSSTATPRGGPAPGCRSLAEAELPDGEVTVAVDYSTVNYKDGLCLGPGAGLVRKYPHVPGRGLRRAGREPRPIRATRPATRWC